ncbi:hypothetical protein D3C86_1544650 [compost metagenome]
MQVESDVGHRLEKIPVAVEDSLVVKKSLACRVLHQQESDIGSRLTQYVRRVPNRNAEPRGFGNVYIVIAYGK